MNALLFSFLFALNVSLWHCFVWKLPAILIEALFCLLTFKSQASKQSALSTGIGTAVFLSSVVSISRLVCPTLRHICYDQLFFLTGCILPRSSASVSSILSLLYYRHQRILRFLPCLTRQWFCCLLFSLQFSDCILLPVLPCLLNHCVLLTMGSQAPEQSALSTILGMAVVLLSVFSSFPDCILLPTLI